MRQLGARLAELSDDQRSGIGKRLVFGGGCMGAAELIRHARDLDKLKQLFDEVTEAERNHK